MLSELIINISSCSNCAD